MTDGQRSARAFVPGHVTGFFSIHRDGDPHRAGSRGAGVTLSDGVTVEVESAPETEMLLNGTSTRIESAERVLDALGVIAHMDVETELPLGAGFGVSGAVALGVALAANHVFGCARSENELIAVAHAADVDAGSGLGDVVAQARGGVPIRLEPGAPEYNRLDGVPGSARVEYLSLGELRTSDVLADATNQLSTAGERALDALVDRPTFTEFMRQSRRFATDAGLSTPEVESVIEDVDDAGGSAAMAMLGETVFALDTGLTDAGYDASVCRVHAAGATLTPRSGDTSSEDEHEQCHEHRAEK